MTRSQAAAAKQRITLEACPTPLRAHIGGAVVAESHHAVILHERGYPDRVYFPQADVRMELLERGRRRTHCPYKGEAAYWFLNLEGQRLENAAWAYLTPIPGMEPIAGRLSFGDAVTVEPAG